MCAASAPLCFCAVAAAELELVKLASTACLCLEGHQEGAAAMLNTVNCKLLASLPLVLHSAGCNGAAHVDSCMERQASAWRARAMHAAWCHYCHALCMDMDVPMQVQEADTRRPLRDPP
jgi:hypothetical protein